VADPENLNRVLVNLIRNAAQAMKRHDGAENVVTVRAARQETQCVIEVVDSGAGVPDKIRERLFEPFATSAPEDGGTGLGLAIARELTRAMGGELELTRTGAVGSTFLITLPAA
jgi:signal transduction histidine kinase